MSWHLTPTLRSPFRAFKVRDRLEARTLLAEANNLAVHQQALGLHVLLADVLALVVDLVVGQVVVAPTHLPSVWERAPSQLQRGEHIPSSLHS